VIYADLVCWRACSSEWGQGIHTEFWWGNLLEEYHFQGREADGRLTLREILGK